MQSDKEWVMYNMFKIFGSKDSQVDDFSAREEAGTQDEHYHIPILHSRILSLTTELIRRQKEEKLREKYGIAKDKD